MILKMVPEKQLTSIEDLFKNTWDFYKKRIGIFLLIELLPFLAVFFLFVSFFSSIFLGLKEGRIVLTLPIITILSIGFLLYFFAFVLAELALIYAIAEPTLNLKEIFKKAFFKIPAYLLIFLLLILIVLGGLVLLIVPALIFAVWFYFSFFILVTEDLKGVQALKKSKELVKDYFWPVAGRMLVVIILGAFASLILNLIVFIGPIVSFFFIPPFTTIFFYFLYLDLKKIKSL